MNIFLYLTIIFQKASTTNLVNCPLFFRIIQLHISPISWVAERMFDTLSMSEHVWTRLVLVTPNFTCIWWLILPCFLMHRTGWWISSHRKSRGCWYTQGTLKRWKCIWTFEEMAGSTWGQLLFDHSQSNGCIHALICIYNDLYSKLLVNYVKSLYLERTHHKIIKCWWVYQVKNM